METSIIIDQTIFRVDSTFGGVDFNKEDETVAFLAITILLKMKEGKY
jgi:hypothetical protein